MNFTTVRVGQKEVSPQLPIFGEQVVRLDEPEIKPARPFGLNSQGEAFVPTFEPKGSGANRAVAAGMKVSLWELRHKEI